MRFCRKIVPHLRYCERSLPEIFCLWAGEFFVAASAISSTCGDSFRGVIGQAVKCPLNTVLLAFYIDENAAGRLGVESIFAEPCSSLATGRTIAGGTTWRFTATTHPSWRSFGVVERQGYAG